MQTKYVTIVFFEFFDKIWKKQMLATVYAFYTIRSKNDPPIRLLES